MKKLLLVLLLVAPLGCQNNAGTDDSNTTAAEATLPSTDTEAVAVDSSTQTRYIIDVEGMSCPIGCPPAVKGALESVAGVTQVDVDYEAKQATVVAGPDFDAMAAGAALSKAGFQGHVN